MSKPKTKTPEQIRERKKLALRAWRKKHPEKSREYYHNYHKQHTESKRRPYHFLSPDESAYRKKIKADYRRRKEEKIKLEKARQKLYDEARKIREMKSFGLL